MQTRRTFLKLIGISLAAVQEAGALSLMPREIPRKAVRSIDNIVYLQVSQHSEEIRDVNGFCVARVTYDGSRFEIGTRQKVFMSDMLEVNILEPPIHFLGIIDQIIPDDNYTVIRGRFATEPM